VTMRWALVGTGMWARTVHAPCLATHAGVEFAGVWSRDRERSAALADQFGVRSFGSLEDLLAHADAEPISTLTLCCVMPRSTQLSPRPRSWPAWRQVSTAGVTTLCARLT
jgi:NAD-dependent oxidoreductase involved in siderophore biosynthesis